MKILYYDLRCLPRWSLTNLDKQIIREVISLTKDGKVLIAPRRKAIADEIGVVLRK